MVSEAWRRMAVSLAVRSYQELSDHNMEELLRKGCRGFENYSTLELQGWLQKALLSLEVLTTGKAVTLTRQLRRSTERYLEEEKA